MSLDKKFFEKLLDKGSGLFLEGKKVSLEFFELPQNDRQEICAVDAGSAPVIITPNVCCLFVRVVSCYMNPKKIIYSEGFVITRVQEIQEKPHITGLFYDTKKGVGEELFSEHIDVFGEQPTLLKAANLARKILEWRSVTKAQKDCQVVVWDGSFTITNDIERAEKPDINSCVGLSKSTGCMGDWSMLRKSGLWAGRVNNETFFVQLHEKSKHVLRADTNNKELLDNLVPWSCDPIFLGYPYPLIVADELARVSNSEASGLRMRVQALFGSSWEDLSFGMQDAHAILDTIKY